MTLALQGVEGDHLAPTLDATLKTGDRFFYVIPGFFPESPVNWLAEAIKSFPSANGRVGYTGEYFNYSFRGRVFKKLTLEEFLIYTTP